MKHAAAFPSPVRHRQRHPLPLRRQRKLSHFAFQMTPLMLYGARMTPAPAVFISTSQRSNETSTPIEREADIMIEGSIVTNPDASNGAQKFRVILKAFEAVL